MNMISTGTFLEEMDTSNKRDALVRKLVGAWEKKNSKIARAGGISLMALTLAACGDDDDTPFSQADVDAAKATAKAEGVAEGVASVDITSDNAAIADAARAEGVASVDITSDNASVIAAAVATAEAAKDAEIATLQASYDALVATNATLQASYDALIAPKSLAATTDADVLQGGPGNDTFTAAAGTVAAADRFIDSSATDSDSLTITHATAPGAFTATNIETINVNLNALGAVAVDAANITGTTSLTVTRGDVVIGGATLTGNKTIQIDNVDASQIGSITVGANTTTVDINSAAADKAGHVLNLDSATGAITVDGAATINAAASTDVRIDAVSNTAVAETGKASVINAAAATTVTTHADLTGSVTVTAPKATTLTINDAQGGATVNAATAHTADSTITITDIDASGATVTVGTGVDDSTTASNISINLVLDGTAASTDVATISGAGYIELDIDGGGAQNVDILNLSGNGAAVIYNLDAPAAGSFASATKSGTHSVEIMGDSSEFSTLVVNGIDVIDIDSGGGAVIDGTNFTNVGKIDLGVDAANNAITLNSGSTLEMTVNQASVNVDMVAGGGADLNLVAGDVNGASAAVGTLTLAAVDVTGNVAATAVGTVTLEASESNVDSTGFTLGAKQNLVITGDENVTLSDIGSNETVTADSVNASGSSGIITINVEDNGAANTADVDSVITGSGNDAVETAIGTGTIAVQTNAGNDTITITESGDGSTYDGGAGNDTFNVDDVSQVVILGGAGNDSFDTAANLGGTIIGGDGTDDLTIDGAGARTFAATFAMSGIETLDITAANGAVSMTGAQLANNSTLELIGAGGDDTFNVNTASTATAAKSADLSNVSVKTGSTVAITVTGNVGVDTITGGVASETFTQTLGADVISGGGTTNADTYATTDSLTETGSAVSVGTVVNLGTTAIGTAAVISGINKYISGAVTEVGAGKVAYVFDANATTNSAVMDTVSGIENVTGSAGLDYVVGTSGDNVISTGADVDYIDAGAGSDTITGGGGNDVILLGTGDAVQDYIRLESSAANNGNDSITGLGSTDLITLDKSDYALNGTATADSANTAIAGATYYEGAAGSAVAATAYDVMVLNGASYANVGAAEDAVAARMTSATDGFVVFHVTGTTTAQMFFDADLSADGNLTATSTLLTFEGVANAAGAGTLLSVNNFELIA